MEDKYINEQNKMIVQMIEKAQSNIDELIKAKNKYRDFSLLLETHLRECKKTGCACSHKRNPCIEKGMLVNAHLDAIKLKALYKRKLKRSMDNLYNNDSEVHSRMEELKQLYNYEGDEISDD